MQTASKTILVKKNIFGDFHKKRVNIPSSESFSWCMIFVITVKAVTFQFTARKDKTTFRSFCSCAEAKGKTWRNPKHDYLLSQRTMK